jgi:hypothetical protein
MLELIRVSCQYVTERANALISGLFTLTTSTLTVTLNTDERNPFRLPAMSLVDGKVSDSLLLADHVSSTLCS